MNVTDLLLPIVPFASITLPGICTDIVFATAIGLEQTVLSTRDLVMSDVLDVPDQAIHCVHIADLMLP
jgi:hypothetical protein